MKLEGGMKVWNEIRTESWRWESTVTSGRRTSFEGTEHPEELPKTGTVLMVLNLLTETGVDKLAGFLPSFRIEPESAWPRPSWLTIAIASKHDIMTELSMTE